MMSDQAFISKSSTVGICMPSKLQNIIQGINKFATVPVSADAGIACLKTYALHLNKKE